MSRLFGLCKQAAAAFFRHDLAFRRDDDGIQIVLEERLPGGGRKRLPSRAELARQKEAAEVALMLEQLRALLAEVPETRQTLRHLVFVEQALAKKGLRALHKLPLDVLQRALEQLEGLVTNWSSVGLANLRSKMAVAVIDREHMDPDAEADAYRTEAVLDPGAGAPSAEAGPALCDEPAPDDNEALAAAYAALGSLAPTPAAVEVQAELGSPSARAATQPVRRRLDETVEIRLRELQD